MGLFLYLGQETVWDRLDPRTKLALLGISFIVVLLPQQPLVVAAAALVIFLQAGLARAWQNLARIKGLLLTLSILTILIWSLVAGGPTPLAFGVTVESLAFGVATALKLVSMLVAGLVLLSTTRVEEIFLALALVRLRLPYPACFAFAMALRWVPEVFDTALRVKEAQQARGLALQSGGWWLRLKRHIPLLVPIFLLTLRRSQTMAWALEAKGFNCQPRRTYWLDIQFTRRDFLALTLGLLILGGFIGLHLAGMDRAFPALNFNPGGLNG